jgi:hypothetical protein
MAAVIVLADACRLEELVAGHLGETEIENLGVAALGDKMLAGLMSRWTMPLRMRGVQSVGDLDGQREHCLVIQRLSGDQMLQGHAIQKLHGDERLLAMFADFVDGANVGMIERRCGARFAAKAFERLRVARQFIGQELEGDEAAEFGVFGLVDHAHAAAAEFFDDAVVGDGLVDHSSHHET